MDRQAVRDILRRVRRRDLSVEAALDRLRTEPVEDLGFATLDLHRALRKGFPEVVYGEGKTPEQIAAIVDRLRAADQTVLVTRTSREAWEAVREVRVEAEYHATARAIVARARARRRGRRGVTVVSAGTSDVPVAEEAALTAEVMGAAVDRIFDVGVAGLHRLMAHRATLLRSRVIVAVAGMEGALPSVIAGLVDCPVLAVPTSTGYGTGAGGHAALHAMLNSCSSGLAVVNIDNGFGAGFLAARINARSRPAATQK